MQHTMDLTNIRSIRDLKAKLAAAEVLFDATAFRLEPGKNKIELYTYGTFAEVRTEECIFALSHSAEITHIGYANLTLAPDPDLPNKTYRAHLLADGEYQFKICVIS